MKIKHLTLFAFFFPLLALAQSKEERKKRPTYIGLEYGFCNSKFRDFATSPLFYTGTPMTIGLGRTRFDSKRASALYLSFATGKYHVNVGSESTQSSVKSLNGQYSKLYIIPQLSNEKWNIKTGGHLFATANLRTNPSLQNNAIGIEIIGSLMASLKAERDLSRKLSKDKKFLFIKYHLKERTRKLSYQLNIGVVNSSYRNGYNYNGQSSILNTPKLFDGYQLSTFSGLNIGSDLSYKIYLNNKNIIQLTYGWNLYKTGGNFEQFELANHLLKLTFLFNTK
ncbi:MAG: hypothetical protein N4A35_10990 [Flavobacteriales bacterium]|jgi:hypothetical protein|nr:hypothetical protein [Flavobacteriales bacterium]